LKGKNIMQRFKLTFRNKSALEQLNLCEQTVHGIAASGLPQTDPAHLTDAQATVAALRTSYERVDSLRAELKSELSRRKQLLADARKKVTRASLGLALAVNSDPSKLLAAGLDLEASKTVRVGVAATPDHLSAVPTAGEGEVHLKWRRTVRRCSFRIECRADHEPDGWKMIDSSFRQTCRIEGLVSGVKYWFRIRAENTHGASAWSNLATARPK
jgi:hypothetical protein